MEEQYEDKSELKKESDEVRRWLDEIDLALKSEKNWRKDGDKVWKVYRSESDAETKKDTFNILWANVEIKRQSIINSTPIPDIRRRYSDDDKVGLNVCELLNRAVNYTLDCQDGLYKLIQCANDFLVPSRGQIRVRYKGYQSEDLEPESEEEDVPETDESMEQAEEAEPEHEECVIEHVNWKGWFHGPGKTWEEVRWICFEHDDVTKEDAKRQFGEKAKNLNYTKVNETDRKDNHDSDKSIFGRTTVYELWDKDSKRVLWIGKDYETEFLDVIEDPLDLKNFFCTPRPCFAVEDPNSLIPIIEYGQYETLAKELEDITRRILRLIRACKVRGVYDGRITEIEGILAEDDNALIAANNASTIAEIGGLAKAVYWMPIEQLIGTLQALQQQRMAVKSMIDELNGMSDIVRGSTNANETATAQRIKANFAAARLDKQKQAFQIFARDLIRLIVEVVSGFSRETLSRMTGLKFITEQEKQDVQQQFAGMQQELQLQPPQTPEQQQAAQQQLQEAQQKLQGIMEQVTWEQVEEILRSDMEREYRIDIETDSTMAADQQAEQEVLASFMQGMAQFSTMAGQAMQVGLLSGDAAKSMMVAFARRFRLGKEVEEQLEKPLPPKGPDPEAQKMQAEMQMQQQEFQLKQQSEQQRMQMDQQSKQAALAYDQQAKQLELQHKQRMYELEFTAKQQELEMQRQSMQMKSEFAQQDHDRKMSEKRETASVT
jgi:hypothetical protein